MKEPVFRKLFWGYTSAQIESAETDSNTAELIQQGTDGPFTTMIYKIRIGIYPMYVRYKIHYETGLQEVNLMPASTSDNPFDYMKASYHYFRNLYSYKYGNPTVASDRDLDYRAVNYRSLWLLPDRRIEFTLHGSDQEIVFSITYKDPGQLNELKEEEMAALSDI